MEYEIRKGHYQKIEGQGLKEVMKRAFGNVKEEDGKLVSSYGAIIRVEAKLVSKTALEVTSQTDKNASEDVQVDTIKHWNMFLEEATGYTAKERLKRLQKKAKEGKL
ncbi:MAG: DUF5611 family protein [Methanomassiliicoccales archaeon]